jgi:hypothetical protein
MIQSWVVVFAFNSPAPFVVRFPGKSSEIKVFSSALDYQIHRDDPADNVDKAPDREKPEIAVRGCGQVDHGWNEGRSNDRKIVVAQHPEKEAACQADSQLDQRGNLTVVKPWGEACLDEHSNMDIDQRDDCRYHYQH